MAHMARALSGVLETTAELLRVLGNETRLRILAALAGGELCVCELVDALGRPHYAVSRDLAALQKVGLVRERREGSWVYHSLVPGRSSGSLPGGLLRLLQQELATATEARADRERLAGRLALREGKRCVVAVASPLATGGPATSPRPVRGRTAC